MLVETSKILGQRKHISSTIIKDYINISYNCRIIILIIYYLLSTIYIICIYHITSYYNFNRQSEKVILEGNFHQHY